MSDVFGIIIGLFNFFISQLRLIPVSDNVSLFDFSFALIIVGISLSCLVVAAKTFVSSRDSYERSKRDAPSGESGKDK